MILSTLWIFALFNYLYADFVTLLVSPATTQMAGRMSEIAVLALALLMETAVLMVVLTGLTNVLYLWFRARSERWLK